MKRVIVATLATLASAPVLAVDEVVAISFQERETDDSFRVYNAAPCEGVSVLELRIDFSTAAGELFFDAAPGEPGYPDEEFDRFVVLSGETYVRNIARPEDGGRVLGLELDGFETGAELRFGIDVDDRDGPVPGPGDDASARDLEFTSVAARMVNAAGEETTERGVFGQDGNATIRWPEACPG